MHHGIREFRPRQPLDRQLDANTLNRILRELESLRITRVVNGTFRKLPGGTEIVVAPQRGGGSGSANAPQPWDLIARVDPEADPEDEDPPYLVTVRPGTLNGTLPTNWDIEETLQSDGTLYYAKAVIATDGVSITGLTIAIDSTPPTIQEAQLFGIQDPIEYLFGLFASGQTYRVTDDGNITLTMQPAPIANPTTPRGFGQLPYDIYYQLV